MLKHLPRVQTCYFKVCSLASSSAVELKCRFKFFPKKKVGWVPLRMNTLLSGFSEQTMKVILTQWYSKLTVALKAEIFFFFFFNLLCQISVVLSTTVEAGYSYTRAVWVFPCVCVAVVIVRVGYPWFQGKVWSIPPISGASLRDILGSLMLSIVGGTKPLPSFRQLHLSIPSPPSPFSISLSLFPTVPRHSHQHRRVFRSSIGWWTVHFFLIL